MLMKMKLNIEGDYLKFLIKSNTKDTLAIFTDKGTVYQIKCNSVADKKWKDKGERLEDLIRGLSLEDEKLLLLNQLRISFQTNALSL